MQKKIIALLASAAPLSAAATDYTGFATLLIGFPAVIAALLSNSVVALSESPGKALRGINGFLSIIFLLSTAFVVSDVLGMLEGNDKFAGVLYILLAAGTVALALRNFGDKTSTEQRGAR